MKDLVKISHLTKFHAFRANRNQVIDLETWFKIHTNVSNVETSSPKTLKIFYQFCDNCKISSFCYHLKEAEMKITYICPFLRVNHRNHKKFKSLYGFGGRCLNIREVCMDFEPCFKVHNLVSVYPKGMKLGQMTNLNVIFHVLVSVYRLITI